MSTISGYFGAILPALLILAVGIWLKMHFERRVVEQNEPSETDEVE